MPTTYWAREDSGSANNPALNLTGADAIEITFVAEDPSGNTGDLQLDKPAADTADPNTQISINGTNYSFVYQLSGTMPTANNDGAQQVPEVYEGSDVVILTVINYPADGETTRLAFMPNESASQVEMDSFGNGAIDIQSVNETPGTTPVCFTKGTLIETPDGDVAVETLRVGDLVTTLDHGAQPIRWIGSQSFPATGKFAPVRFRKGTLGNRADLSVSQQHRMLISGWQMGLLFSEDAVLATAKSLVNGHSIATCEGGSVTYYHLLFDRHEIVFAHGIPSESFHPGMVAMDTLGAATREEIRTFFPELRKGVTGYGPAVRLSLRHHEGRLAARELGLA